MGKNTDYRALIVDKELQNIAFWGDIFKPYHIKISKQTKLPKDSQKYSFIVLNADCLSLAYMSSFFEAAQFNHTQFLIYVQQITKPLEKWLNSLLNRDNLILLKTPLEKIIAEQMVAVLMKKIQLTQDSRHTLDASHDGILVVDENNKIVDRNEKLQEIWEIPDDLFAGNDTQAIFSFIAKKLKNKLHFLDLIQEIKQQQDIKNEKLHAVDNRIFELNSHCYQFKNSISRIWNFRDVTARAISDEKLQFQATHDALTGLANRALLFDRLHLAIAQATREKNSFAVLFLDLNHFKLVNDSLGHTAGDKLLIEVAERLKSSMRRSDTLARMGGDEFVVISSAIKDNADFEPFLHKLLATFEQPFKIKAHSFSLNASIGVAVYPFDGSTPEELLSNADEAMYFCKQYPGNQFQYFNDNMRIRHLKVLNLQEDFDRALKNNEFFLCYQPEYDLVDKQLKSVEALVRWRHPQRGLLLPMDFIPDAEKSGFIVPLGEWVLRTACVQNKLWQEMGLQKVVVAVNIAIDQLKQVDFADKLKSILDETGLDPQYLELELTENTFVTMVKTKDIMLKLQALGIKLALDNFGSGYSSLNYLRKVNVNRLKIDPSFIHNIDKVKNDELMIEAIISMGQVLGFEVLAEGVEKQEQINFLEIKNCDNGQGYFFSRPMEAAKIQQLLSSTRR